jgi:hypothetical protein
MSTILPFLFEIIYSRGVITGELRVVVDQIVSCLCSLALKVDGFELFAWADLSMDTKKDGNDDSPMRPAVRPTSFIFASIDANDVPTA